MRAIDTNVLVRLVTRDDAIQTEAAEAFVETGVWVSTIVLAETIWVLETNYGLGPAELQAAVDILLKNNRLVLQDLDAVAAAADELRRRPTLGFSDCLILALARKAGHLPLGTFDRALGRVDGAQKL